jgi:2-dehydropantoate 2-reductase
MTHDFPARRVVVIGAGAVGAPLAAALHEHGHPVLLVARGANFEVIARDGLTVATPERVLVSRLDVADGAAAVAFQPDDVVILATKSQDTVSVLDDIAASTSSTLPILCAQNGVANERVVGERFKNVYGMCVMTPASYLEPGRVDVFTAPLLGVLDVGRWPDEADTLSIEMSSLLRDSGYASMATAEIATLKYGKLLSNVLNVLEVLCGRKSVSDEMAEWILDEARACMRADGVDVARAQALADERSELVSYQPIEGVKRVGSSSFQSVLRGTGNVETDYLNGEIVALGRKHHIATPVNELLQQRADELVRNRRPPGSVAVSELRAQLGR